jgi:signal transduction histidine kinase
MVNNGKIRHTLMNAETLKKLLEIGKQLSKNRSLDPLLHYAMKVAIELVDAECGFLLWLNDDNSLIYRVCLDHHGNDINAPEEKISHTILREVIEKRAPLLLQDALVDPNFQHSESVATLKLRSVMCVPLISKEGVLGALYVENRSAKNVFVEEDIQPLEFLASQVTIAIENALLNEVLEQRVIQRTAELEQALQQVEKSLNDAVELDRVRSVLFAMIAHDIRAPLSTIVFALNLLKEDLQDSIQGDQLEWLETSIGMTDHVDQLTKDFLDLLSAQIGKLVVEPKAIDLEEFLLQQFQINRSTPWPAAVEFRLDLASDLPTVFCDPIRFQQVVTNLISNAVKYTQQGSVTLYARKHDVDDKFVLIGVRDTGIGIAADDLEKVFKRFEQIGETGKRQNGLGLGLAICKELIDHHKGQIWVESTLGQGADFKFTLPVA